MKGHLILITDAYINDIKEWVMLGLIGPKGLIAYNAIKLFKRRKRSNSVLDSEYVSAATKPLSIVGMTAFAYGVSRYAGPDKLERFLLTATASSAVAGLLNTTIKRLIGRKRPRALSITHIKGPTMDDDYHSMPSGHAAVLAAITGSIPRTSGPLLAASVLSAGVTAVIGKTRLNRNAHYASDILVGSAVGFAAAWLVSSAEKRVREALQEDAEDEHSQSPDYNALPQFSASLQGDRSANTY